MITYSQFEKMINKKANYFDFKMDFSVEDAKKEVCINSLFNLSQYLIYSIIEDIINQCINNNQTKKYLLDEGIENVLYYVFIYSCLISGAHSKKSETFGTAFFYEKLLQVNLNEKSKVVDLLRAFNYKHNYILFNKYVENINNFMDKCRTKKINIIHDELDHKKLYYFLLNKESEYVERIKNVIDKDVLLEYSNKKGFEDINTLVVLRYIFEAYFESDLPYMNTKEELDDIERIFQSI